MMEKPTKPAVDEMIARPNTETLAAMAEADTIAHRRKCRLDELLAECDPNAVARPPNATTRAAIAELEAGKGQRFASVDDLMADLHASDD